MADNCIFCIIFIITNDISLYIYDTDQTMQQQQHPSDTKNIKNSLPQSSAYPTTKHVISQSPSHQLISHSLQISNDITIRAFQLTDIHQLKKLNIQFFPLRYHDTFYYKLLNKQVYGYIAEVQILIEDDKLKDILEKQKKKQEEYLIQSRKKKYKGIYQRKNQYYLKQQGLSSLYRKSKKKENEKQIIRCKVIIGSILFNIRDSEGYLQTQWWKSLLKTQRNSIYISTLGVINQFRNKKLAQRLINRVIKLAEDSPDMQFIYLHAIQYNVAARKLYQKMGFQVLEDLFEFYHVDGKYYNGVALGKFYHNGKKKQTWGNWIKKYAWWQ